MAEVINMPRLSDTMEEGTVAQWFKKVGDSIKEGDILAEIETDKATMEFEAFYEGELLHIGIQEGASAPVDTLLAIVGEKGEDISALLSNEMPSVNESQEEVSQSTTPEPKEKIDTIPTIATPVPEGVQIVKMPRLSDTMEEGTVATWLKKAGDAVQEGDILAEIETDKATMEFESFYSGQLIHIGIQEGESAPVDAVLAVIGPEGTDAAAVLASATEASVTSATENKAPEAASISEKTAVAPPPLQDKKEVYSPAAGIPTPNERIIASPLAKKIAAEKGINLSHIQGTGDHGRIVKKDIESYQPSGTVGIHQAAGVEQITELANSQMRKTIAKRLSASKFSAPHYYLGVEYNMDAAIAFRTQYNSLPNTKISFNDIVIKAAGMALKIHPEVNSQWYDNKIVHNHHVHVGVAVAVEDGLLVPVLKFANELALPQIGLQVKDFASRARNKKLTPAEMEGSTFTISNLGMFGIQEFTSIINQPNSAILSVGSIVQKPVVEEGDIVIGNTMKLTLACDHRTVDGATGAQFLQTLRGFIENPITMLVS